MVAFQGSEGGGDRLALDPETMELGWEKHRHRDRILTGKAQTLKREMITQLEGDSLAQMGHLCLLND